MKAVSEDVAATGRSRAARMRRLLWRAAGGGRPFAEMTTVRVVGRTMLFTLLAVSLVGTLMTAAYLPSPWGRLLVLPAAVGALCMGITAGLYVFLASFAVVEAAHRRTSAASAAVRQNVARRRRARAAPSPK